MPVERAVSAFQNERRRCAESILSAFQEHPPQGGKPHSRLPALEGAGVGHTAP